MEDFPEIDFYAHQPSFDSLQESSKRGCHLCSAIVKEFSTTRLDRKIEEKKKAGLHTGVGICISICNKESDCPNEQIFDRLLVCIGVSTDEFDEGSNYSDQERESDQEDEFNDDVLEHMSSSDTESIVDSDSDTDSNTYPEGCTVVMSLTRHKGNIDR